MSKKKSLVVCVGLLILFVLTGCGKSGEASTAANTGGADSKTYDFIMCNQAPPEDVQYKSFDYFAGILNERSNGRINAKHYGNNTLGSSNQEQTEMTINGSAQFTSAPGYVFATLSSKLKGFNVTDYPYLFETTEECNKFWDGPICKRLRDMGEQELGIYIFPGFNMGWVQIYSNVRPMKTPKDVAGQKIRTSVTEIYVETLKAWGCNPTPINWVEVYTALQQKTVDGLTTPSLLAYYQKFYEVQKYMSVVNFNPFPHYPLMSKAWYDGLPDEVRKVFDGCKDDYLKKTRELHKGMESEALVLLEKAGLQIIRFDKESIKPWKDPVRKVWDSQVDFAGKEILEEVKTFLGKA